MKSRVKVGGNRKLLALLLAGVGLSAVGCGESQHDIMMRAAQRVRDDNEVEEEDSSSVAPPVASSPVAPPSSGNLVTPTPPSEAIPETIPESNPPVDSQPTATSPTIADRRPTSPLDELARRKRAAENIKQIGAALTKYVQKNQRLPLAASKTANGAATLSWRVELLPYLGYAELYAKFDSAQPWDSPTNLPLLDLIPDCYVSPERFDTNTNYLGIVGNSFVFAGKPVMVRDMEDGLENTLAILEANDTLAVPWTSPMDFAPAAGQIRQGIGKLRPEGTYALWANGWTTLLPNNVSEGQLQNAFTYESGDGQLAGAIHKPLIVAGDSTSEVTSTTTVAASPTAADVPTNSVPAIESPLPSNDRNSVAKIDLPSRAELSSARQRVDELYAERLKNATRLEMRREIAQEMLKAAKGMANDPGGAHSLHQAAIEIAVTIGDLALLNEAVDGVVAQFNVNFVDENTAALQRFCKQNTGAMSERIDRPGLLKRALPIAFELVKRDEYDQPIELATFLLTVEGQQGQRVLLADLNRLKQQLTAARNQYRQAAEAVATLRNQPDNANAKGTVGKYVAFIKGDWATGLPMLLDGDNDRLAQIAKADLATGNNGEEMLNSGDAWWDLAESTTNKIFRGACQERAAHWYRLAEASLPESLSKLHAKSRLEKATQESLGSPLSLIERLAEDSGIKLDAEIARVRNPLFKQPLAVDDTDD